MSSYKNANGDSRETLERYLPTAYKTIDDSTSEVHRAFFGAIKNMLVTTEQELIENTKQVFINYATGSLLDLYGKWVGVSRNVSESDDDYRVRILYKITEGRATVENIINGIKYTLGNDVSVSIYEPWRNIFILNKSLLNGPDNIMGLFYRYAVIQVMLDKYFTKSQLSYVLSQYKAAGVQVVFVYAESLLGSGGILALPLDISYMDTVVDNKNPSFLKTVESINDLPNGDYNENFFITNKSKFNSTDVLSGSNESTYKIVYGSVPSKNIAGILSDSDNPTSTDDPYDFIYQKSKVDYSTIGGRNLLLGTQGWTGSNWDYRGININPSNTYNSLVIAETGGAWNSPVYKVQNLGILKVGSTYTFSTWIRNTSDTDTLVSPFYVSATAGWKSDGKTYTIKAHTDWQHIYSVVTIIDDPTKTTAGIRWEAYSAVSNGKIQFAGYKLEEGNVLTDWSPAPEDDPKTYIYPYKQDLFTTLGKQDEVSESFNNSVNSYPTFSMNISDFLISKNYVPNSKDLYLGQVTELVLDLRYSPYGLQSTNLIVKDENSQDISGLWYDDKENQIGTSSIKNDKSSSGIYHFKLNTPSVLSYVELRDYYPNEGPLRTLSAVSSGQRLILISTTAQTGGSILFSSYAIDNKNYVLPYIKSLTLGNSTIKNPEVYNYNSGVWVPIDKNYNLQPFIQYGSKTGELYVTVRDKTLSATIDYVGLLIEVLNTYIISTTSYILDNSSVDNRLSGLSENLYYKLESNSNLDTYNTGIK